MHKKFIAVETANSLRFLIAQRLSQLPLETLLPLLTQALDTSQAPTTTSLAPAPVISPPVQDILNSLGETVDVIHQNGLKTTALLITEAGLIKARINTDKLFKNVPWHVFLDAGQLINQPYLVKNGYMMAFDLNQQKALLAEITRIYPELKGKLGFYNLPAAQDVSQRLDALNPDGIAGFWTGSLSSVRTSDLSLLLTAGTTSLSKSLTDPALDKMGQPGIVYDETPNQYVDREHRYFWQHMHSSQATPASYPENFRSSQGAVVFGFRP